MALVSVQFIISSLRLRLIIPSSSLINLDIRKTSSNNCSIRYYQKPETYVCFCQKFLISLNYILTCALILTCKHWDSLICTQLPALLSPVYALSPSPACTYIHLHAPTFTCMHLPSLAYTYIHLYALICTSFTCICTLTFTCMHLHSLSCTYIHLYSLTFTCMHLPSLACTYIHLHALTFTCTQLL